MAADARRLRTSSHDPKAKFVKIISVNYDFMPTTLEMPKMFWVDLVDLPPRDLVIGTRVKLHIPSTVSTYLNSGLSSIVYRVEDLSGSRVVLAPISRIHSGLYDYGDIQYPYYRSQSPFGWGYETTAPPPTSMSPSTTNVKYGYGTPVGLLEYVNPYYTTW